MTDAPERITAWRDYPDGVTGRWSANTYDAEDAVEYIRADLVDRKPAPDCHQQDLTTEQARQAGFAAGIEAAAKVLRLYEREPCKPASGWTDVEKDSYAAGQVDASISWETAIRALSPGGYVALPVETVKMLEDALLWYAEQARLARLIHSEGDKGRHAISADGGTKASAALAAMKGAGT